MRKFLLILFVILSYRSEAQTTNAVYPYAFIVDNDLEAEKIKIYNNYIDILGTISFNVHPTAFSSFNYMETKFEIVDGSTVLFSQDGPTFSKSSDFYNNSNISNAKHYSINLSGAVVANILNSPNAKLIVRYRYKILNNASWLPSNDTYYRGVSSNEYSFKDARPRATIIGPDEINTEGTYQVDGAVSFEEVPYSASGYKVYNATLTHLGSGSYIVTAKPGFIGSITLLAKHSNGLETYKVVQVKGPPLNIQGPSVICSEEIYTINSASSVILENATGIATLSQLGSGQWKVSRMGSASGNVILKASDGVSNQVSKYIYIGIPDPEIINFPTFTTYNSTFNIVGTGAQGATFQWEFLGLPEGSTVSSLTTYNPTVYIPAKTATGPNSGFISVYLTTTTSCGQSNTVYKFINYAIYAGYEDGDVGPEND